MPLSFFCLAWSKLKCVRQDRNLWARYAGWSTKMVTLDTAKRRSVPRTVGVKNSGLIECIKSQSLSSARDKLKACCGFCRLVGFLRWHCWRRCSSAWASRPISTAMSCCAHKSTSPCAERTATRIPPCAIYRSRRATSCLQPASSMSSTKGLASKLNLCALRTEK
jgi:hypothetical protein